MMGRVSPEKTHGAVLLPHQAVFIERFYRLFRTMSSSAVQCGTWNIRHGYAAH
jgi:hypothetical protein